MRIAIWITVVLMLISIIVGVVFLHSDFTGNSTFSLKGRVVDEFGQPIEGVSVSAAIVTDTNNNPIKAPWGSSTMNTGQRRTTDAAGRFVIEGRGVHVLVAFKKGGYEPANRSFDLMLSRGSAELRKDIDFVLRKTKPD